MKLISCSLFNSWDTLKKEGSASLGDKVKDKALSISKLPPGQYNLESLAKEIDSLFDRYSYQQYNSLKEQVRIRCFASLAYVDVQKLTKITDPSTSSVRLLRTQI